MRRSYRDSILFQRKLKKLKGKSLRNVLKKIDEVLESENIEHNLLKD